VGVSDLPVVFDTILVYAHLAVSEASRTLFENRRVVIVGVRERDVPP